jgi:hypothetical protein
MSFEKRDPIKDFKMLLLKQTLNRLAPRILRFSEPTKPETPQSRLVLRVWSRLEETMKREVNTGCFNDRNFSKLLETTKRALIFLCENDKYYKRWLGLLAFYLSEELGNSREEFSYKEALGMTVRPLGLMYSEFLNHRNALFELHMTGYLYAMGKLTESEIDVLRRAKAEETSLMLPTEDPKAYIKLFFPTETNTSFTMFFKERGLEFGKETRKTEP